MAGGVETERLRLLLWSDEYFDDFARICADPEVVRYITGGDPLSRADVEEIAARTKRMWQDHGFGPWAAIEKASGRWVGRIGLTLLHDWPDPHKWEIGFELDPDFWGRGFAAEGAREGVRAGFEEAGLERIISVTVPEHHASRRVMEKCGLTFRGEREWRETRVVWYAIDRDAYARSAT